MTGGAVIYVKDLDAAIAFYAWVAGLPVAHREASHVLLLAAVDGSEERWRNHDTTSAMGTTPRAMSSSYENPRPEPNRGGRVAGRAGGR